jgi:hypothetical protein
MEMHVLKAQLLPGDEVRWADPTFLHAISN